ncbi:MAG: lipoate--protein ligase family protein [Gemmataceae bacterium]|nr:lipoate--protein ligase family protein [Gemmataceae bacterium]
MNQGFDFIKRLPDRMDPVAVAMACDDAMLSLAEKGIATIRIYYWGKPELSLGYFQPADIRLSMGYNPQPPWARRSTGGEALLHHYEWTYAFALPASHPLASQTASLPCRIHGLIAQGLLALGYPASLHEGEGIYLDRSGLCFQHLTAGDLIVGGHKVMGSAQRKRKGAVLQHGGLLLRQSELEKRLSGLADLVPNLPLPTREEFLGWLGDLFGPFSEASAPDLAQWGDEVALTREQHQSSPWRLKR